jgi:NitT/TauT family transport system substrate-binding protein
MIIRLLVLIIIRLLVLAGALNISLIGLAKAETIRIGVGHQSMCTDTYPAGIVVKELQLLEKRLPHDGKYAGVHYDVVWSDYESGAPITNQMLANKLNFGVMGDYPLVVNGAKFQETSSLRTLLVAGTAYNRKGSGNAIVVPAGSNIHSIGQLRGRSISTPVGSAAWGMLVKALADAHIPLSAVELKNQSPTVGAANIAVGKIDAHADFCPWSEIMQFRGTGRVIYDGSETGVPYLHGVVVRKDFAEKYPEIVVAFIKAIYDAERWIESDPLLAVQMMEKWTGVEKEVLYLYFSKGGYLTLDPTLKPEWIDTLKLDHKVLADASLAPALDLRQWVDEIYIKRAYAEMGLDYAAQRAVTVDPVAANQGLPNEVWHARDGIMRFSTLKEFLASVARYQASGAKINATYTYDQTTGLKIFGKSAYYVLGPDGTYSAFLRKIEAEQYASLTKGRVFTFAEAVASQIL